MKILALVAVMALCGCVAVAAPVSVSTNVAMAGTNLVQATLYNVSGYLDEILVSANDATSVASVAVYAVPPDTYATAVTVATNEVTASKLFRPRFDGTGTDGAALGSDPPGRVLLYGETIIVRVANTGTNVVWTFRIKTDK